MKAAAGLRYGCTLINTGVALVDEMPDGGTRQSGSGKDMSMHGLEDCTVACHVMAAR